MATPSARVCLRSLFLNRNRHSISYGPLVVMVDDEQSMNDALCRGCSACIENSLEILWNNSLHRIVVYERADLSTCLHYTQHTFFTHE